MSWLFSQALVEAFLPESCSGTEPCAQLNVMPTPQPFWRNDKTMEPSRFSRFGLTYAPLTADRGEALLIAYLAASRARTSASPETEQALKASAPAFGASSSASFARLSPDGSAWKTAQCSLLEDSPQSLLTLPRWGSMRNGKLFQRATLMLGMSAPASGSLLPTLTVCGNYNAKGASRTSGDGLVTVLKKMPTLVARDYRHPGRSRLERTGSKAGDHLPNSVGGPLNPDWCEWFMGFPIGWTALGALEMPRFREWQQQHSPLLQPSLSEAA
jgi:hypothetical protein